MTRITDYLKKYQMYLRRVIKEDDSDSESSLRPYHDLQTKPDPKLVSLFFDFFKDPLSQLPQAARDAVFAQLELVRPR